MGKEKTEKSTQRENNIKVVFKRKERKSFFFSLATVKTFYRST